MSLVFLASSFLDPVAKFNAKLQEAAGSSSAFSALSSCSEPEFLVSCPPSASGKYPYQKPECSKSGSCQCFPFSLDNGPSSCDCFSSPLMLPNIFYKFYLILSVVFNKSNGQLQASPSQLGA